MQQLLDTLQEQHVDCLILGASARSWLQHKTWRCTGVIEILAKATLPQLASYLPPSIYVHAPTHLVDPVSTSWNPPPLLFQAPLLLDIEIEEQPQWAYVYLVPTELSWPEILTLWQKHRCFSLEALAISPNGTIFDPFHAQEDLARNLLRFGPEHDTSAFKQQPISLLTMARLASELGFSPDASILDAAEQHATQILYTSRHEWFREITMLLCGSHIQHGLHVLWKTRVLGLLLPEIHEMIGFAKTSLYHHKDLWEHTGQVVAQAVPQPLVRWAALLHDVGKLWTRTYDPPHNVHFYQHEELGAILTEGLGVRFRMAPTLIQDLAFLVRNHLRPNAYQSDWTNTALRRLLREAGHLLQPLLHLSRADMTSALPHKREHAALLSQELWERIQQIQQQDQHKPSLPPGIGHAIMEHLQSPPGPHIGEIKLWLEQQIQAGILLPHQETSHYLSHLQNLPHAPNQVKYSRAETKSEDLSSSSHTTTPRSQHRPKTREISDER